MITSVQRLIHQADACLVEHKSKLDTTEKKISLAINLGLTAALIKLLMRFSVNNGKVQQPSIYSSEYHFTPLVIAPIVEEFFFRYLLQGKIFDRIQTLPGGSSLQSKVVRIFFANMAFALIHQTWAQRYQIFIMPTNSVVFELTGSVRLSMLSHAVHNFSSLLLFGLLFTVQDPGQ